MASLSFTIFSSLALTSLTDAAEKHVVFTFELVNGKLVPVIQNTSGNVDGNGNINVDGGDDGSNSGISSSVIALIFIVLLFLWTFVTSVLVIVTISSSVSLKRSAFNLLLLNLCVVCLLEAVLNMLISVIYLASEPWELSYPLCYINSALMEYMPIVFTFLLVTLAVDRAMVLRDPLKYKKMITPLKVKLYMTMLWMLTFVIVGVVLVGAVKSWPFPKRYSCQVMHPLSLVYGIISGLIGYLLWWIVLGVAIGLIVKYIMVEKKKERKQMRGGGNTQGRNGGFGTQTTFAFANAHLWNELKNIMLVGILLLVYLLLMPYVFRTKIDQLSMGYDYGYYSNMTQKMFIAVPIASPVTNVTNTTAASDTTVITFPGAGETPATNSSTQVSNQGSNTTVLKRFGDSGDPNLVPEVDDDRITDWDTVFVWFRFLHFSFVPLIILLVHKDLRKKAKDLICCWRPNSVDNTSPRPRRPKIKPNPKGHKTDLKYSIPVLFATTEGLHLRVVDDDFVAMPEHKGYVEETMQPWTVEPEFSTEFCDLQLIASGPPTAGPPPEQQLGVHRDSDFGVTATMSRPGSEPALSPPGSASDDRTPLVPPPKSRNRSKSRQRRDSPIKHVQFKTMVDEIPLAVPEVKHQSRASPRRSPAPSPPRRYKEGASPRRSQGRNPSESPPRRYKEASPTRRTNLYPNTLPPVPSSTSKKKKKSRHGRARQPREEYDRYSY